MKRQEYWWPFWDVDKLLSNDLTLYFKDYISVLTQSRRLFFIYRRWLTVINGANIIQETYQTANMHELARI